MSVLRIITDPSDYCNWVISRKPNGGGLLIGDYPYPSEEYRPRHLDKLLDEGVSVWISLVEDSETVKYGDYQELVTQHSSTKHEFIKCPMPDRGIGRDSEMYKAVSVAFNRVNKGKIVYVHCWGGHGRSGVFSSCFLMLYYGWDSEKAIDRNHLLHATRKYHPKKPTPQGVRQYSQIRRYRPPIHVIVSGDRDSVHSFRPVITRALKDLPPFSTIVHGACRGIDTMAGEIAVKMGFQVKEFPATGRQWKELGRAAGPIRNRLMLDTNPSYVLAFHPDIIHSKGTKDMMMAAHLKGIPVFLYDLKDKKKFDGNFELM